MEAAGIKTDVLGHGWLGGLLEGGHGGARAMGGGELTVPGHEHGWKHCKYKVLYLENNISLNLSIYNASFKHLPKYIFYMYPIMLISNSDDMHAYNTHANQVTNALHCTILLSFCVPSKILIL